MGKFPVQRLLSLRSNWNDYFRLDYGLCGQHLFEFFAVSGVCSAVSGFSGDAVLYIAGENEMARMAGCGIFSVRISAEQLVGKAGNSLCFCQYSVVLRERFLAVYPESDSAVSVPKKDEVSSAKRGESQ